MSKLFSISLWLLLFSSFLPCFAQSLPIGVQHYNEESGFPSNQIFQIVSDETGVLWLATSRGLCKFDGGRPEPFYTPHEGTNIVDLKRDSTNRIWLSDIESCVGYLQAGTFYPHPLSENGTSYPVGPELFSGDDGLVWAFMRDGNSVIIHDDTGVLDEVQLMEEDLKAAYCYLNEGHPGQIVVLGSRRVWSIRDRKVDFSAKIDTIVSNKRKVLRLNDGRVIVQFENIIFQLLENNDLVPLDKINSVLRNTNKVSSLIQDREGRIWFATNGKLIVVDEEFNQISMGDEGKEDFTKGVFNSLVEDIEGNIWVGTNDNGLFKIDPGRFFYEDFFLEEERISVVSKQQGSVYVGTFSGKLFKFDGLEKELILNYPSYKVHRVAVNEAGELLCSYFGSSTFLLHNRPNNLKFDLPTGFVSHMQQPETFWHNQEFYERWTEITMGAVKSVEVIDNKFYAASSRGIAWLEIVDDSIELNAHKWGKRDWAISQHPFYPDSIFIIKTDGIYNWNRTLRKQSLLFNGRFKKMGWSADGTLWVTASERGLFRRSGDSLVRVISPVDPDDVYVNDLSLDGNKAAIATNMGATVLDLNNDQISFKYFRGAVLPTKVVRSVCIKDSLLYCGGDKGLSIFHLAMKIHRDSTRNRRIQKVFINGELTALADKYKLRSDKNNLKIVYSVLRFNNRSEIFYQYKLHGSSGDEWTDVGSEVALESLSPGKYTFEVRSKLAGGPWSKANPTIEIEVIPFLYERRIFWVLLGVLFMGLVAALMYIQFSRIAERERATARMDRKIAAFEMKAVQAQMNPHFISNALTSIQYFVLSNDSETANKYLSQFSRLIRLVLDSTRADQVLLKDELSMLRLYLNLEVLRLKNLSYEINVDPAIDQEQQHIPSLLTQPFVENSVKHAYREGGSPVLIKLNYALEGELLKVTILDDGQGMAQAFEQDESERARRSHGMDMISEKIEILKSSYGQLVDINIVDLGSQNSGQKGTKVEIRIQLED